MFKVAIDRTRYFLKPNKIILYFENNICKYIYVNYSYELKRISIIGTPILKNKNKLKWIKIPEETARKILNLAKSNSENFKFALLLIDSLKNGQI